MTIRLLLLAGLTLALAAAACTPPPAELPPPPASAARDLDETVPPDADWRGHQLARCPRDTDVPAIVEKELGLCWQLFRDGSGSDGIVELELTLAETGRHPLILVALGQLYLMAGQGVPELLPTEGPAADTGSWERNRPRLLARARELLLEAGRARPDDAAVDYLLADVARAGGDFAGADRLAAAGLDKCTGGRSFLMLRQYQELNLYPPELRAAASPEYPEAAVVKGVSGQVVLDVLLDPAGLVRQVAVVSAPSPDLARAAGEAFRASEFAPGRIGKYPVWAWLRVATNFSLAGGS